MSKYTTVADAIKGELAVYERRVLSKLLSMCSPAENEMFNKMYGDIKSIPLHRINRATEQAQTSLMKRGVEINHNEILSDVHFEMITEFKKSC